MTTPVWDFLRDHCRKDISRFHMPGHKGSPGPLGCEPWDLTEIPGADDLSAPSGIIAESEENASGLFGSRATFYAAGGSSQCVRAMLYLALANRPAGTPPVIAAARNVHKSFVYAAALLDFQPLWLWPEAADSLCACPVTAERLEEALTALESPPAAVYVTSPDYLGNLADIPALAEVCHRHGTLLLADNAHGAYLRFLEPSLHPLDLGADLVCDSAHKTLPVLTGGAYLHIARRHIPAKLAEGAREALALFGSTSPSYLILASLDLCNAYLAGEHRIPETTSRLTELKESLLRRSWQLLGQEPLKLTINAAARGWRGTELAERLRSGGIELEYADRETCVLMASPQNTAEDFTRLAEVLDRIPQRPPIPRPALIPPRGERALSIRESLLAPQETVPASSALGRICGAPAVSCPPAVPIAVSGERIGPEALALFERYEIETVRVVKET